jgi:hypothetical protein
VSADGPATYWARTVRPGDVVHDLAQLDRRAVAAAPEYAAVVTRTVAETVAAIRAARADGIVALADEDPGAAAHVGMSGRRKAAYYAGVLAAATAFALYFSRADLDPVAALPWAAALIAACAVLMAIALLPIRRSAPPTTGVAAVAWTTTVLSGAALLMAPAIGGVTASTSVAYLIGLAGCASLLALAVGVTWGALRVPPVERARTVRRIESFPGEVADSAREPVRLAVEDLRTAWASTDPVVRARVESDLAEAYRVLDDRGVAPTERHTLPGALVLARTAVAVEPALDGTLDLA